MTRENEVQATTPEMAVAFLRGIMPFNGLGEETLNKLARHCRIDFFPKGTMILTADQSEVKFLYLIQQGGVKAFLVDDQGEVSLKDFRGEGAYIGALAIIRGTLANLNIETVEDTFCFLLPRELFLALVEQNAAFASFYLKSFSEKIVSTAYNELRRHRAASKGNDDLYLFSVRVGEIVKTLRKIGAEASIREAATLMAEQRVGSLLVHESANAEKIVGIITDRDLRSKVVAAGLEVTTPVAAIMSSPVRTVLSQSLCFDVLLMMMGTGIHHLAVERSGRIIGVVTSHDIMLLQGHSPYYLFKEIKGQREISGLYPLARKIPRVISGLITEGAKAGNIAQMIAILNDQILERMLTLLEQELGPAPLPWCWLLLGSEGRREQTLMTDQDNALLYAEPADEAQARLADGYFKTLGEKAIAHLIACGYPPCPGGIMASNPKWRQSVAGWRGYFDNWLLKPEPLEVMHSTIFFDFRAGYGDATLAESLRQDLARKAPQQEIFLLHLARNAVEARPPLSFFRNLIVEKNGEHKNSLDLKVKGLTPFVDFARLFSLKYGIMENNTLSRLQVLHEDGHISHETHGEAVKAYEFLMQLRLVHQLQMIELRQTPDNHLNPADLSELEKQTLKEAFEVVRRLQSHIRQEYRLSEG